MIFFVGGGGETFFHLLDTNAESDQTRKGKGVAQRVFRNLRKLRALIEEESRNSGLPGWRWKKEKYIAIGL